MLTSIAAIPLNLNNKHNIQFKGLSNFGGTFERNSKELAKDTKIQYCLNYFAKQFEENRVVDFKRLREAHIPNLRIVDNRGVRGETLSSPKNDRYLPLIKKCGIDTVIDLRGEDYTPKYKVKCDKFGLNYVHFPIDKDKIDPRTIIDKLPEFFNLLERGKFYIACAQGLHRTDIALALNYVFNPKQKVPPFLAGHTIDHTVKMENINRRINSVYRALTPEDKAKLGWTEDYEKEFLRKRTVLRTFSEAYVEPRAFD